MQPKKIFLKMHYVGWRDRKNPDLWFYSWNGTSFFVANDELSVNINLASWSARGGWKDNAFIATVPRVCSTGRASIPSLWRKMMVAVFNDPDADCPFQPGSYSFSNFSTDFDIEAVPSFFYGKWRATGKLFRTSSRELLACARAYGSTVPKLSKRNSSVHVSPHRIESQD
ncbi:uncharacterized protein LOC117644068 [Thrips palmi]|uniref:Uncharacterized protein LOC117644068 n=1 Tax=Thrips palmi TaxID=161013 RepID=A0A6P8YPG5_THRPL|nr:uncharacterized protein LOC117644068 [Thrips palmi]